MTFAIRSVRSATLLLLGVLLFPCASPAAIAYSANVEAASIGASSVDVRLTGGAAARVELTAVDVVRVQFAPGGVLSGEASGAIASPIVPPPATISDAGAVIYLLTSRMAVAVVKSPYQVVVWDADGSIISADLTPAVMWDPDTHVIFGRKYAPPDEHYFGFGERGGAIDRRGRSLVMKNVDVAGYSEYADPLYISIPFFYAVRQGRSHAMFVDNPALPFFDLDSGSSGTLLFGAFDGDLTYYVIGGPEPVRIAASYANLTGHSPLPPKWTLGYHQSRFGYRTQDEFLSLAASFRAQQIPCDALYFDLDYMDARQQLTWNPAAFPDPIGMNGALEQLGFRRVNIVDPFVLATDRLSPFMTASNFFVTKPDGTPFVSTIFLGQGSWIDFTRPAARDWYKQVLEMFLSTGVSAVWNDLNEPADNFMNGAVYDFGGAPRPDLRARNVYALNEVSMSYQAQAELRPNVRPWILSRSGYAGIQRYAANWSGDTSTSFDSLRTSIEMSVSMGLSGQIQFGHDVGGFLGSPSPELYMRWLEFASMTPFFRTHSIDTAAPREPWAFGEPYTSLARGVIDRHYEWLPYIYSLFERASRTGEPVLAPTFFYFPSDERTYKQDTAFMLGGSVLVAPVSTAGASTVDVYLPTGTNWVDYNSDAVYAGGRTVTVAAPLGRVPILVREGAVLPRGPVVQNVDDAGSGRMSVDVYAGPDTTFSLYEDDGISFDYTHGAYVRRSLSSTTAASSSRLDVGAADGPYQPPPRAWWLNFHDVPATPASVSLNGTPLASVTSEAALDSVASGWYYRPADYRLLVRVPDSAAAFTVAVQR